MAEEDKKKRILIVFGTRPEAIKMAPLILQFKRFPERFEVLVCVTGQHRQMLDQVLTLFEIYPDYDLNIMQSGQDLYDITARVLRGMRQVLMEAKPDWVLVHGDTSTSTATALAAFYQQIAVGHVEAGLRTYNTYSPWPEEMNRQLTGRIATFHFAPTTLSKRNLLSENIKEENIFVTGNTVIDALYLVLGKIGDNEQLKGDIHTILNQAGLPPIKINTWLADAANKKRKLILITGHRRENFGDGFIRICQAIKMLSERYPEVDFVYPMHLNPNVRNAIEQVFGRFDTITHDNLYFIEPLDYLPFVYLMNASYLLLTDSGGIQEEAPGLGKPVLVMRDTTERPEALEAGTVKLVGTDEKKIIDTISILINNNKYYSNMAQSNNPYGDGKACKRIVEIYLNQT